MKQTIIVAGWLLLAQFSFAQTTPYYIVQTIAGCGRLPFTGEGQPATKGARHRSGGFGAARREGADAAHAIKARETRIETWHHPVERRHTEWPRRRAVVSTAIACCRGASIVYGLAHPASSDSDGDWRKL
jgi:hypothetical protein